jgi:hypothetical protein
LIYGPHLDQLSVVRVSSLLLRDICGDTGHSHKRCGSGRKVWREKLGGWEEAERLLLGNTGLSSKGLKLKMVFTDP